MPWRTIALYSLAGDRGGLWTRAGSMGGEVAGPDQRGSLPTALSSVLNHLHQSKLSFLK